MNWFAPMDIYCERTSPEFWAEPVNALSNISFVLAAIIGLILAIRAGRLYPSNAILIGLVFLVGTGSFLFHTFANQWSDLADILPIWTFVIVYAVAGLRYFFGFTPRRIIVTLVVVLIISVLVLYLIPAGVDSNATALNGSEQYVPAILALVAFGFGLQRAGHKAAPYIWAGLLVFIVSLVFRTLDQSVCNALPIGTHFGWHLLNGILLGLLLVAMIRHGKSKRRENS